MKFTLYLIVPLLTSCQSMFYKKTDFNHYSDRVTVSLTNYKFLSASQMPAEKEEKLDARTYQMTKPWERKILYSGYTDCNPPFSNKICRYLPGANLNIEYLEVKLVDEYDTFNGDEYRELIYFIASELAIQRNFANFILTNAQVFNHCSNFKTLNTNGTVSGSSFSSSSFFSSKSLCSGRVEMNIILFNDYKLITSGVFYYKNKNKYVEPFMPLYAKPPMTSNYQLISDEPWKSYFVSNEVLQKYMNKYNLSEKNNYKIQMPKIENDEIESLKKSE